MAEVLILGAGAVDARGVVGTAGARLPWAEAGLDPERLRWRACFPDAPFPTFRRLDPLAQRACLAVEAAGSHLLGDAAARVETALVLGTAFGCLSVDLAFAASLAPGQDPAPALFPYTLPSTCLGEVALRHRLRGPTACHGVAPGDEAEALREAALRIEEGEARAAVVILGDALSPAAAAAAGLPDSPPLAALLLAAAGEAARAAPPLSALRAARHAAQVVADALWEGTA